MRFRAVACVSAMVFAIQFSSAWAETVQTAGDVFDGRPYLYVEAESFASLTDPNDMGWKVVTKGGPDFSTVSTGTSFPVLPLTSNVNGTAIWARSNDFAHDHTAHYELKFITPGTYQFFMRQSLYDFNGGSLLSEDSVFLPPAFNKNSGSDWVGYEKLDWDETDVTVDVPINGFALDPDGYKLSTGNHDRDGILELQNWGIKSEGSVEFLTTASTQGINGDFKWYNRPTYQGINAAGSFESFYGFKAEFAVTPDMVGQTLLFEIGMREVNVTIDSFMFIQTSDIYPDMDVLDIYSQAELDEAVIPQAPDADYNGDGTVNAADYTVWRDGGSPDDTQAGYDLWAANFGNSGSASASTVPEPASIGMLLMALGLLLFPYRR